jgi:hypothetical protein
VVVHIIKEVVHLDQRYMTINSIGIKSIVSSEARNMLLTSSHSKVAGKWPVREK